MGVEKLEGGVVAMHRILPLLRIHVEEDGEASRGSEGVDVVGLATKLDLGNMRRQRNMS